MVERCSRETARAIDDSLVLVHSRTITDLVFTTHHHAFLSNLFFFATRVIACVETAEDLGLSLVIRGLFRDTSRGITTSFTQSPPRFQSRLHQLHLSGIARATCYQTSAVVPEIFRGVIGPVHEHSAMRFRGPAFSPHAFIDLQLDS